MFQPRTHLAIATFATLGFAAAALGDAPRYRVSIVADPAENDTISTAVNRTGTSVGYLYEYDGTHTYPRAFVADKSGVFTRIDVPTNLRSEADAINDRGVVSGTFQIEVEGLSHDRLFRYTPESGCVDLGTLGGRHGSVYDMNNRGDIVGYWSDATGEYRAFKYSDATGWTVLYPNNTRTAWGQDINDRGEVVGNVWTSGNSTTAWYWRDGVLTEIGNFGGSRTSVYYINNSGVAIGHSDMPDGTARAFRWSAETGIVALPLLPGAVESKAFWITDAGTIGGTQRFEVLDEFGIRMEYHAFTFDAAHGLVDLGVDIGTDWQSPVGMNETGAAVFTTMDLNAYELHPYVYSPEFGAHELNDVLEGDVPFVVDQPMGINACGEISAVAWSAFGDVTPISVSVLLSPIRTGDLDGDSDVDLADYARLQANFATTSGAQPEQGDLDGDGDVDARDAQAFIAAWRSPCR
ncbi:MAG TPA: dockerin type I domain-containing protein [Phycisphaerae bacterium]|nr:hypothetical protein [Phycisphaerales bacterium]HRX84199.1 dockerin type I domain-containing protein [Phycisphaerae bacterium]